MGLALWEWDLHMEIQGFEGLCILFNALLLQSWNSQFYFEFVGEVLSTWTFKWSLMEPKKAKKFYILVTLKAFSCFWNKGLCIFIIQWARPIM